MNSTRVARRRVPVRPPAAPAAAAALPRLDVGVVGAGRVGAPLGAALARAGHRVVAVSAASRQSRDRARLLLPDTPVVPVEAVPARAHLVLLAVPDDALEDLVALLAARLRPGQVVAHTSGRQGLAALAPAVAAGALPLALHPVLPFRGTRADVERLAGCAFGVTCDDGLRPLAAALVEQVGGVVEWVPEHRRVLWHAALASAANHVTTLVNTSADLLRTAGVREPDRVLAPLVGAALQGACRSGDDALTGPVVRGDAGTVQAHLEVLAEMAPEVLPSYLAMARLTADRAIAAGRLDPRRAGPMLQVLGGVPG